MPQDLSLSKTDGCKVAGKLLNLFQYYNEDIYEKQDQICDPAYLVCDIRERHSKDLPESMNPQGYHFELVLMTVVFSVELNSDSSSVSSLADETEG